MMRKATLLLLAVLCAATALGQQTGGNGVPGGPGSGAAIPATSNVLKGSGTAGSATAATPGTDVITPALVTGSQTIQQTDQLHLNNITVFNGALIDNVTAAQIDKVVYAAGAFGAGVGVAQVPWVASTLYPQCQAVSYSAGNYIEMTEVGDSVTTPGTNSAIWYPVQDANTPTGPDCAMYFAASQVSGSNGASLVLPPGEIDTCIGWKMPTVTVPGNPSVNILGQGKSVSQVKQTCSISTPVLQQPNSAVGYAFASFDWENFTVNANFLAPSVIGVYGAQQFAIKKLLLLNAADGSDHYIEFGQAGGANNQYAWTYEADLEDIDLSTFHGGGSGAQITVSVSTGVPTFTVVSGGSNYTAAYLKLILSGATTSSPCSSRGTDSFTVVSGAITAVSSTATGCNSTTYASIFGQQNVAYGFKFNNFTDSKLISGLTDGGIGSTAGFFAANITGMNKFYNLHPIGTMVGVQDSGNNNWYETQMDTIFFHGFDFEGASNIENIYGTKFEYGNQLQLGLTDYYFGTVNGSPVSAPYAISIFGDSCGNQASFNGYTHLSSAAGSIDAGDPVPGFAHIYETVYCNHIYPTAANTADVVASTYSFSDGFWGNGFQFQMNSGGGGTFAQTGNLNGSGGNQGRYQWNFANQTPATSGQNYGSPSIDVQGTLFTGSASQSFGVIQALNFGSGASPTATYQWSADSAVPSGGLTYAFDHSLSVTGSSTASGGFIATSDGVHAAYSNWVGNTANQAVAANTWGIMGPAETTYTGWAEQPANATSGGPSAGQVKIYGAPSAGVSQWTLALPALLGSANTFTAAQTNSTAGAASTPAETWTGAPYTGGSTTTNFPLVYLNDGAAVTTLSSTGTEFGINAPSGFTGHLINLFVNGGSTRFRVDYAGDVFMAGTETVTGAVTFNGLTNADTGDYVCYNAGVIEYDATACVASLRKFKYHIAPLHDALSEVMQLKPVQFRYVPSFKHGSRMHVGFIAEDVEKVDPRIAAYTDKGVLESVDYQHLTAINTAALQELNIKLDAEIQELRTEIAQLKAKQAH